MPSNKEYNVKINRLKNTRKMTRTMKLVSMSKLIKAQDAQRRAKTYAQRVTSLISRLASDRDLTQHPLFRSETHKNQALIILFTSDRGLCGGFNNNLIRGVNTWLGENEKRYESVHFSYCGRRGHAYFKNRNPEKVNYVGVTAKPDFTTARKIGEDVIQSFLKKEYKDVYVAYNHFNSPLSQVPHITKILPIEPKEELIHGQSMAADYGFEPARDELLSFLIPKYVFFSVYFALLENAAGEHGARMTAMESATKNTEDLIERLTLMRNRARQASITRELIEIISGAEALNQ